jgi:hypothetical protein
MFASLRLVKYQLQGCECLWRDITDVILKIDVFLAIVERCPDGINSKKIMKRFVRYVVTLRLQSDRIFFQSIVNLSTEILGSKISEHRVARVLLHALLRAGGGLV